MAWANTERGPRPKQQPGSRPFDTSSRDLEADWNLPSSLRGLTGNSGAVLPPLATVTEDIGRTR
jgi:hypothetical protein